MIAVRKRWPWIAAAAALAALALAAVTLPRLLDVERHRGRIEQSLRDATGWNAELGAVDLSLLGGLVLRVSPVRLEAPEGGSSVEVGTITVRASLLPLFRGVLEVERIELLRPEVTLVRAEAQRGWVLPFPPAGGTDPPSAGPALAGSQASVRIERIEVTGGTVHLEDRSVRPAPALVIEELDAELQPATGALQGGGSFAGDGGRVRWQGTAGGRLDVHLEQVRTEVLALWLGAGVLHPGGRLGGDIELDLPRAIGGTLTAESLRVLAGDRPLPATELDFRFAPRAGGWTAERLTLRAGEARVEAHGSLLPLELEFEFPPTPLETALALSDAAFPLGLDVTPPGSAEMRVRVDMPEGGELTYEVEGELSAARLVAADLLPPATDVRASFALSRAGELRLRILEAKVGGGPLEGTVHLDSIDPLGTLVFEGRLSGASLGSLLAGFVADTAVRVSGPTVVEGTVAVDLGTGVVEASSIGGALKLGSDDVSLAGWDLEAAVRRALRQGLGKLGGLAALIDAEAARALGQDDGGGRDGGGRLLDHLAAEIAFDDLPWRLRAVELRSGSVTASGEGSFDPRTGRVDLDLLVELDRTTTEEYVRRHRQLRALANDEGRLAVPMRLAGPMTAPSVELDLGKLAPLPDGAEGRVKGLLEELIRKTIDR